MESSLMRWRARFTGQKIKLESKSWKFQVENQNQKQKLEMKSQKTTLHLLIQSGIQGPEVSAWELSRNKVLCWQISSKYLCFYPRTLMCASATMHFLSCPLSTSISTLKLWALHLAHTRWLITACSSLFGGSEVLFGLPRVPLCTCSYTAIKINLKNIFEVFKKLLRKETPARQSEKEDLRE